MKQNRSWAAVLAAGVIAFAAWIGAALATTQWPTTSASDTSVGSVMFGCQNGSGQWVPATTAGQCLAAGAGGNSGTPTQSSATVGTASAQLIAASTFTIFMKVCIAQSAANGIWVNWAGAAATQAAPSEYIPPGQCDSWVASTGYLPTSQINAIASASVAATIIGK